jgi:hypothetical protein
VCWFGVYDTVTRKLSVITLRFRAPLVCQLGLLTDVGSAAVCRLIALECNYTQRSWSCLRARTT